MNNIRKLRQDRGWTIRDLSELVGMHFTNIARIERSERKLTFDSVERFANAFGVTPGEVIEDPFNQNVARVQQIPVIGQVAAGAWREAVRCPDDTITAPVSGKNIFALRVDGSSMDKVAPHGALVLVDPDQFDLHDGRRYVVMNEEAETTFKQYRAGPARLEPMSSDPAHETIILGRAAFTVVGQVLGVYQSFL